MKKKNIISVMISLLVALNMVFCVSAYSPESDSLYGTSEESSESINSLSGDTGALNQGLDENPLDSVLTDGDTVGAVTTTDAMQAFLEDDLPQVTPGNTSSTDKPDMKIMLIIGAIIVIAAAIVVVLIAVNKKKNSKEVEEPVPQVKLDIPTGSASGIKYSYEFRDSATVMGSVPMSAADSFDVDTAQPIVEIDNTHNIIMSIYKGEATPDAFGGKIVPLVLTNVYDLQISDSIQPAFATGTDLYSSDYILVNDKYLYLNFNTFNKAEFKLYSDIVAVQRCFTLVNRMGAVISPANQSIFDFEPAVFEINGTDFVICEKGKITVE